MFSFEVRTDAEGHFSIRGIPASRTPVFVDVLHPSYQKRHVEQFAPTLPDAPLVIQIQPGCVVAGFVVDEQGRGLPGTWVQLRPQGARGTSIRPTPISAGTTGSKT